MKLEQVSVINKISESIGLKLSTTETDNVTLL